MDLNSGKHRVLVVDDEENMRKLLVRVLSKEGCEVQTAESGSAALRLLRDQRFDLVISDLVMPVLNGIDLMLEVRSKQPELPFILITAHGTIGSAVEAMKAGAFDYLTKPAQREDILRGVRKALQYSRLQQEVNKLRAELQTHTASKHIVWESLEMKAVFELIGKIADSQATVLILGESGTGKELVARAIHDNNPRRKGPFVAVDCSVLPEQLLQSELFGHVKGAFTGAVRDSKGLFLAADGGTLFLDEIGNISATVQLNLLRVLQEREIKPVGSSTSCSVDVRVLAATNEDLEQAMQAGRFRRDLYYRLSVVTVRVPPLRERTTDIVPLARHFLRRYAASYQKGVVDIAPGALRALLEYAWPGNVRELENVMERAVLLSTAETIDEPALAFPAASPHSAEPCPTPRQACTAPSRPLRRLARSGERDAILAAIEQAGGNKTQAAKLLGISRSSLYNKLAKDAL